MAQDRRWPVAVRNPDLDAVVGDLAQVQADLRAVSSFLKDLIDIDESGKLTTVDAQKAAIQDLVNQRSRYVTSLLNQIGARMGAVYERPEKPDGTGHVLAPYRFQLAEIHGLWEQVSYDVVAQLLKDAATAEPPEVFKEARACLARVKRLRCQIGAFTIPRAIKHRIEEEEAGVGVPFDFHEKFKDEVEDPNDRVAILRQLAERAPDSVGGMVDVEAGVIYLLGGRRRRWWSYLLILLPALLGALLVTAFTLGHYALPADHSPGDIAQRGREASVYLGVLLDIVPSFVTQADAIIHEPGTRNTPATLWAYFLLVIAGVLTHTVKKAAELSTIQRAREVEGGHLVILDRLPLWIHVREYRFLLTVFVAVVTFVSLVSLGQLNDYLKAFLTGYTVDSVADLVLHRFSAAVSAHAKTVREALRTATSPTTS